MIDDRTLSNLLALSRLDVDDESHLKKQLEDILGYFELLSRYDTSEIEADFANSRPVGELRSDAGGVSLTKSAIESFSSTFQNGFFIVPHIMADTEDE